MRTATALVVLALIACAGAVAAQRQDEALDSLMLESSLQPVNDPIPRLLQEALESATATPGTYGTSGSKAPATTGTGSINTPEARGAAAKPAATSSSSSAAAGVVGLVAAAAVTAMLL